MRCVTRSKSRTGKRTSTSCAPPWRLAPIPPPRCFKPWSISAGDEKLGLVYVPTGNVADDYISSGRTPQEDAYNSSIVAIDVTTGKPRWTFQTVRKDVWDYDLGSPPTLICGFFTPCPRRASACTRASSSSNANGLPR